MSVYCVNSGNTYSDLLAAEDAEHGQHVGLVTFEVSGFDTSSPVFSGSGYDSVLLKCSGGGEWDGVVGNLHCGVGSITSSADVITIQDMAVKYLNLQYSPLAYTDRCLIGYLNGGGTALNNNNINELNASKCLLTGTAKTISAYNANFKLDKCTVVSASGYGFIRANVSNCAALNTGSATTVGSTVVNTYTDDGAQGTVNNLAESDFVDYANGDYRLKADSAAALAGAGAFVEEAQQASEHNVTTTGAIGGYTSLAVVTTAKPEFNTSVVGGIGGYASSLNIETDKPSFNSSAVGSVGGYSSLVSLEQLEPGFNSSIVGDFGGYSSLAEISSDVPVRKSNISGQIGGYGASIVVSNTNVPQFSMSASGSIGGYSSAVSATYDEPNCAAEITGSIGGYSSSAQLDHMVPVMPAVITGIVGGYNSSVTLYNGELNIITPPQNIVTFTYQSTNVELKTRSRIVNV